MSASCLTAALVAIVVGLTAFTAHAVTYYVQPGSYSADGIIWIPASHPLQTAINESAMGDTILVDMGIYDPITTSNKCITIRGIFGAGPTIINGGGTQRCATLGNGNYGQHSTVLTGFTLRNGRAGLIVNFAAGGGVLNGTLNDCVLTGNTASLLGIACGGGAAFSILKNCILRGNTVSSTGQGLGGGSASGGGAYDCILSGCTLTGNTASYSANDDYGGASGGGAASSILFNCTVAENKVMAWPKATT